jgi:hypothetical protein
LYLQQYDNELFNSSELLLTKKIKIYFLIIIIIINQIIISFYTEKKLEMGIFFIKSKNYNNKNDEWLLNINKLIINGAVFLYIL